MSEHESEYETSFEGAKAAHEAELAALREARRIVDGYALGMLGEPFGAQAKELSERLACFLADLQLGTTVKQGVRPKLYLYDFSSPYPETMRKPIDGGGE